MLIAEASVVTARSGRYLAQLCKHVSLVARANPRMQVNAEWSEDRGVIRMGASRCTLRADPGVLTLRAEAPDGDSLLQLEQRIEGRLTQIGRRDQLTVSWTEPRRAGQHPPNDPPTGHADE